MSSDSENGKVKSDSEENVAQEKTKKKSKPKKDLSGDSGSDSTRQKKKKSAATKDSKKKTTKPKETTKSKESTKSKKKTTESATQKKSKTLDDKAENRAKDTLASIDTKSKPLNGKIENDAKKKDSEKKKSKTKKGADTKGNKANRSAKEDKDAENNDIREKNRKSSEAKKTEQVPKDVPKELIERSLSGESSENFSELSENEKKKEQIKTSNTNVANGLNSKSSANGLNGLNENDDTSGEISDNFENDDGLDGTKSISQVKDHTKNISNSVNTNNMGAHTDDPKNTDVNDDTKHDSDPESAHKDIPRFVNDDTDFNREIVPSISRLLQNPGLGANIDPVQFLKIVKELGDNEFISDQSMNELQRMLPEEFGHILEKINTHSDITTDITTDGIVPKTVEKPAVVVDDTIKSENGKKTADVPGFQVDIIPAEESIDTKVIQNDATPKNQVKVKKPIKVSQTSKLEEDKNKSNVIKVKKTQEIETAADLPKVEASKADIKVEMKPEIVKPHVEAKPEAKPNVVKPVTQTKPEPKVETKPEVKVETRPEANSEVLKPATEVKSESSKPVSKPKNVVRLKSSKPAKEDCGDACVPNFNKDTNTSSPISTSVGSSTATNVVEATKPSPVAPFKIKSNIEPQVADSKTSTPESDVKITSPVLEPQVANSKTPTPEPAPILALETPKRPLRLNSFILYVDPVNAKDDFGDRITSKPFITISAATNAAVYGDTISIRSGEYEKLTCKSGVEYLGVGRVVVKDVLCIATETYAAKVTNVIFKTVDKILNMKTSTLFSKCIFRCYNETVSSGDYLAPIKCTSNELTFEDCNFICENRTDKTVFSIIDIFSSQTRFNNCSFSAICGKNSENSIFSMNTQESYVVVSNNRVYLTDKGNSRFRLARGDNLGVMVAHNNIILAKNISQMIDDVPDNKGDKRSDDKNDSDAKNDNKSEAKSDDKSQNRDRSEISTYEISKYDWGNHIDVFPYNLWVTEVSPDIGKVRTDQPHKSGYKKVRIVESDDILDVCDQVIFVSALKPVKIQLPLLRQSTSKKSMYCQSLEFIVKDKNLKHEIFSKEQEIFSKGKTVKSIACNVDSLILQGSQRYWINVL